MRIALRISLALVAVGVLGVAAGIVTLGVTCPAGCPQVTTPPAPLLVAIGAFVVGAVGAVGFGAVITSRQSANRARPQTPIEESRPIDSTDATRAGGGTVAEFRPIGLGLRKGIIPTSSSLPGAQRFTVHPDGLEMRNVFERAWVPRDRIIGLYRLPGAIRVIWDAGDDDCTGTVSAWFGIKKITGAMEQAGYRFDED